MFLAVSSPLLNRSRWQPFGVDVLHQYYCMDHLLRSHEDKGCRPYCWCQQSKITQYYNSNSFDNWEAENNLTLCLTVLAESIHNVASLILVKLRKT